MQNIDHLAVGLSELLVAYALEGALVAESSGRILARVGSFEHDMLRGLCTSPADYRSWIPKSSEDIRAADDDLEGRILPRMAAQGDATAYFMRPAPGYFAVAASVRPRGNVQEHWQRAKLIAESFASIVHRAVEN